MTSTFEVGKKRDNTLIHYRLNQNKKKSVDSEIFIVLAACNGGAYLAEQLNSLLGQSEKHWTLLIRDDHSVDNTAEIISEYTVKDQRIEWLQSRNGISGSALSNFSGLLNAAYESGAKYVFCCDQDDVWHSDKLAIMLEQFKKNRHDLNVPCLIHHDLVIVDRDLRNIHPSFVSFSNLSPADHANPQRLLSRNEVTGCAMACNRALLRIALPLPDEAIMHDWWLALSAAYFGNLTFLSQQLVKYRQHGENVIGAKSFWHGLNPLSKWISGWQAGNKEFLATVNQARAFQTAKGDRIESDPDAAAILETYCNLPRLGRFERLLAIKRCGVWRHQWLLDTVLVLRMLLLPRDHS